MSIMSTLAPIGVFACSLAAIFSTFDASAFDESPTYNEQFSQRDFDAFDRSFDYHDRKCEVGIERKRICFSSSPLEAHIEIGETMPAHAPVMPAPIPVLLRTTLKPSYLTTHRYGHTLVLVEDETGIVVDKLDLASDGPENKQRKALVQYADIPAPSSDYGR